MSSRRSIMFLLAGIAILVAAHFAIDCSGRGARPAERRSTLCGIQTEKASRIVVARCGEAPTVLARGASGWRIAAPFAAAADERVVKRLLDALAFTPVSDAISEADLLALGRERADFALEAPVAAVTVAGDGMSETVSVGAPTPTADGVYACVSGVDAVFVAPPSILAAMDLTAGDFRMKSLLNVEPSAVVSFGVRRGGGEVATFVRGEDGWTTGGGDVSAAKIKAFLSDLASAEASEFVWPVGATNEATTASEALLSVYGLDPDSAVTVTLKDAAGSESQVSFGKEAGEGLAYARVQNGTAVVTVSAALRDAAARGTANFSDSRLLQADARDVTAFTVTDGGVPYALPRSADGAWRLESPIAAPADKTAVDEMLARILALSAADADDAGVVVALSPGAKQATVSRKSVLGGGRFEDLRSKEAVRIDPAIVRRLVRTVDGETSSAVYARDRRAWGLETESVAGTVDEDAVKAVLAALNPLEATKIEKLKVSAADLAAYGLDSPVLTLSIDQDRDDAVRRNLIVGGQASGGGRYATVGSSDAVFVISDSIAGSIARPIVSQRE